MIVHLFLNSLLVFFIMVVFVETFLTCFRIESARTRSICRSLPLLKLPFDLVFFSFYGNSPFINLNPFSCEIYLQQLILSILPSDIQSELGAVGKVIIPEYISSQIPAKWLHYLIIGFIVVSILLLMRKIAKIMISRFNLKKIFKFAVPCLRPVQNEMLKHELTRWNTVILTSSVLQVPIAAYRRYILMPKNLLNELSQDEFEAVIAHELEHLRWKDPVVKLFFNTISTLFWWIPTIWWLKKLDIELEQASDSGLHNYGIENLSLASALMKVVNKARNLKLGYEFAPICYLNSSKSIHFKRFENLLKSDCLSKKFVFNEIACCLCCFMIFICFWMC